MPHPLSRRALLAASPLLLRSAQSPARPNILWITCEDLSPILGCYGDRYAATPHLDRLASQGVRYTRAFSTASVCSPSRSCLITGVVATSLGTMHLRGMQPLPPGVTCFTEHLRNAGYYTSNNEKQDYNFIAPPGAWDESSAKAHYRNRKPGQPFFSVFNLMTTHQGQIRYPRQEFDRINASLPPAQRHDPARAPLPPYYPDTPTTRLNIAELYTQTTLMDAQAGALLEQLEKDGLADDTIVFFFSDHGTGLERSKRWLHESGTRVPLIVRFPEKFRRFASGAPGTAVDRIVNFSDFAPTVLALAGLPAPAYMQGAPFLGPRVPPPPRYTFFHSDRVDEVVECCRSVRDARYQYIRNFLPHRPRMQHNVYSELGLVRQELRRLDGQLKGDQALLLAPTLPAEELYDIASDPHQLRNLAADPTHAATLRRLRERLFAWIVERRDTGLLPEPDMLARAAGRNPRESEFPIARILAAADLVGRGTAQEAKLREHLKDPDAAVRYWSVVGHTVLGKTAEAALNDESAAVRIAAAEGVLRATDSPEARAALERDLLSPDSAVALHAAIAFWYLGEKARPSLGALRRAAAVEAGQPYQRGYAKDTLTKTIARFT
ncbi:MAG TPA: sulfatase [Solibacterales bacterium]|nr:sulfatase [Bryobacterales bacterium]